MIGITSTAKGKGLNKSPKTALSPTFQPPHLPSPCRANTKPPSPIGTSRSSHLSPETNTKTQNQLIYSNLKECRCKPQNSPVWLVQGAAIYINIAAPCTTEIHTENQHLTLLVKPRVQPRFLHHLLILCFSCNPVIPKNKKSPKHFPFSVKIPIFASVPRAERSNAAKPAQLPNRYRLPNFLLFKSYLPTDYKKTIVFHKKRFILQRKYRTVNQALLLFGGTVLFSSIHMLTIHFPPGFKEVSPLSGVLLVLCVACSFFMMEYVNEKNLHQSFFILMYRFTLGYLLVNDLLLLAQMPSVSGMESSTIIYLIGNKFEVTYMHLFFSALYYQVFSTGMKVYLRQYIILVMHLVLTLFIAIGVECSTGVLGVVLLAVFLFLYKKIRFIFRPFFAIILMLLFGAFFLLYETILAIPSVQYLIVDILNEDLTLTGRTYIYTRMLDLMDTQPWFGYGNGTATFFTTYYIHEKLTNTQNGLLNDYIDWGIIGVICLIILTYSVLRSASSRINPFICLIYTYIVLSSIEITLGLRFLAVLPMCMWANKKNN